MSAFEQSGLWAKTLAPQAQNDRFAETREALRSEFLRFRGRAAILAAQIARDLPDYTVHDISHIDALWQLTDVIVGYEFPITPTEAFVLGGAFLVHDLGNGLAAYPDGVRSLRTSRIWRDTLGLLLRAKLGRAPHDHELDRPDAATEREATSQVLRKMHAMHAERLGLVSWRDQDSGEDYHLIEDSFLRHSYGALIGKIAHSHWWPASKLPSEFDTQLGAPAGYPNEWTVDPLKLACVLRVSDAAHLDASRAPTFLKASSKPAADSRPHWVFQEKINQPLQRGDRLVYTSSRSFTPTEADAWWLCFDSLQMLDRELSEVDAVLADCGRRQFAIRGVQGAEQAERLSRWVQTDGWIPVDTRIRVSDVASLAQKLGGEQLYGKNAMVPLRELIQNACDAVRARRYLESLPPGWGDITVRIGKDTESDWVEVSDNGLGMSASVIAGPLLDFGSSYWSGVEVSDEWPGLMSSGFEPTGKYGIGFFSVFMWGKHVRVTSRRFHEAQSDTHVLEFTGGLRARPILRPAGELERLREGGTSVRVWLDQDPLAAGGIFHQTMGRDTTVRSTPEKLCEWMCPAIDCNLFVERPGRPRRAVVRAADWLTLAPKKLIERVLQRELAVIEDSVQRNRIQSKINAISEMLRPVTSEDGTVVGRIALVPDKWDPYMQYFGAVTAGGLRACGLYGIGGLLVGRSNIASRDIAIPVVPADEIRRWLLDQEQLVLSRTGDPEALLECAAIMWFCGVRPNKLPILESAKGLLSVGDIKAWCALPREVVIVNEDAISIIRREKGAVRLKENVLSVGQGWRSVIDASNDTEPDFWPRGFNEDAWEFTGWTLEGLVITLLAEAWSVSPTKLAKSSRREKEVVVAEHGGIQIKEWATVFTNPNLSLGPKKRVSS